MEQRLYGNDGEKKGPDFCPSLPSDGINNPGDNLLWRFFVNLFWVVLVLVVFVVVLNGVVVFLCGV